MKTKLKNIQQGFTIIEVLIVLAIAGLIMAIVFFAVPQLQRNSRDNQRHSTANRVSAELTTYSGNNQGTYPFAGTISNTLPGTPCTTLTTNPFGCNDWYTRYIGGTPPKVNTNDPSSSGPTTFNLFFPSGGGSTLPTGATWQLGRAFIAVGSSCQGENGYTQATGIAASSRKFAILMPLDRQDTWYCVDNG